MGRAPLGSGLPGRAEAGGQRAPPGRVAIGTAAAEGPADRRQLRLVRVGQHPAPPLGATTLDIVPGSPRENAYSESFNSRFRDEFLNREVFASLKEAKVLIEDHRREYNDHRPHSSLNYQTPAAFAASCRQPIEAPPRPVEVEPKPEPVLS